MLFWIVCAALTAGVVLVLTRPLTGAAPGAEVGARAADLYVYRDQLREIDADVARGLIGSSEADAARIEISRRILSLDNGAASVVRSGETPLTAGAYYALAAVVPLLALGIYLALGSPGLPGRPASERIAALPANTSPINELLERVEARLREHPRDGQGWDVLAPVYMRLERYQDAAQAFENALAILGETSRRLAGLGEARVMAANGVVGEGARKVFVRLLELEPGRPEARFWLAIAKEQDGDQAAAAADYRGLLAEAPADVPWREVVEQRLAALGEQSGTTGGGAIEQRQLIEGMVERLADRLRQDGSDVVGWQRLLQSYAVLGRTDAALSALADARAALGANAKALAEIDAFAGSLGLASPGRGQGAGGVIKP